MQHISSMIRREGEESKNRGFPNKYQHSKDKMGLCSHYHLVEIQHGNEELANRHDDHTRRHPKRKHDGNALHSELKKLKHPTFDGENMGRLQICGF